MRGGCGGGIGRLGWSLYRRGQVGWLLPEKVEGAEAINGAGEVGEAGGEVSGVGEDGGRPRMSSGDWELRRETLVETCPRGIRRAALLVTVDGGGRR